mmetsp:Transcript_12367/g.18548  ORF Transcript_12367/g.18548 Transcript_12367/m.18548 type:complete len:105 (-) Transcript_12367:144-458(-)
MLWKVSSSIDTGMVQIQLLLHHTQKPSHTLTYVFFAYKLVFLLKVFPLRALCGEGSIMNELLQNIVTMPSFSNFQNFPRGRCVWGSGSSNEQLHNNIPSLTYTI